MDDYYSLLNMDSPIILIYFSFRGLGQVARHLLSYLNLEFVDILLDRIDEQRKELPTSIFENLKGLKIDKTMLPILIH